MEISDNKRIAKNTVMLYVRMLFTTIVGLYTSRVVLGELGVQDYGIYGIVGSVVAMIGFLNSSMSGATSRFITFELGRGDKERLGETFSAALIVHIGVAVFVFIVLETIGLWFLKNRLVIPPERMEAALFCFHLSVLSAMLTITQVPYNATIIAHERMDVFAYIEIINTTLKLLIVYVLSIANYDKLILYGWLVFGVSFLIMGIYRAYSYRHYVETHFQWPHDKGVLRRLLKFSGWDLYGNLCVVGQNQGIAFLVNIFGGVVVNAAANIALTVNGMINGFATKVITAFRPQIIKSYSINDYGRYQELMINAVKFTTLLLAIIAVPAMVELPMVLKLWLGEYPEQTIIFCRIIILTICFSNINTVIGIGIHATGDIKGISVFSGTLYALTIPVSYILLKTGLPVYVIFVVAVTGQVMVIMVNLMVLRKKVFQFSLTEFLSKGITRTFITVLLTALLQYLISIYLEDSFVRLMILVAISVVFTSFIAFLTMLNRTQRHMVLSFISNKINRLWPNK